MTPFQVRTFALLWLSSLPVLFLGWLPAPPTTAVGHLVAAVSGAGPLALAASVVTAVADAPQGWGLLGSSTEEATWSGPRFDAERLA